MHNRRIAMTILVILPILIGLCLNPTTTTSSSSMGDSGFDDVLEPKIDDMTNVNPFSLSQSIQEGILNPNLMTQRGYQETGSFRARTDTGKNAQQDITIDEENNWSISETRIEVTNLRKLYAVNGTFDDEVDPWTNSTYDPSSGQQTQSAVWNSTEGYVTCVNIGKLTTHPVQDDTYTHYAGSEILWLQTVTNSPQTNNFSLSFDYRYVSGPVDTEPYDFDGDVQLRIHIHTSTYYLSIGTGDSRNVWYSISDYPIYIAGAPASFDVKIGLYIAYDDLVLTENGDYDDDTEPDGLINAQKIEVNLDDLEFNSQTPVAFADVNLTLNVEGSTSSIIGVTGGTGTATVANTSLWDIDPLEIEVTANDTVSFDYFLTTYFQRFVNSSWTTDLSKQGVIYSIDAGQSADLEMYTYIVTSSEYENLTLQIGFPADWENVTILDPLQSDITGLCTISSGSIFVPNSLFNRVGWWKITYQSINYATNVSIQIEDNSPGGWTEASLFRPGNSTRTQIEMYTSDVLLDVNSPVDIDWIMPNGTTWASEAITNIADGIANSSTWTFGGSNTSAGQWEVQIFWNNGTELAYGFDTFDLYHSASASVQYPTIETDYGFILSNQIILTDADTGHYLLDESVTITANWSSTIVEFSPNYAKNWWQAEFDTALLDNGLYTVIVDISRPYFDPISAQFTIISTFETVLEILNAGAIPIENGLFNAFTVELSYELWNGTGIEGAVPTVTYTGPQEGIIWGSFIDKTGGLYSLDIISNVSTTYVITISFSKPYHYNASDTFTLTIQKTGTELVFLNGTADIVEYGDSYRLVVEYRNSTDQGLSGADISVLSVTPSVGLGYIGFSPISEGYYEIIFTPSTTGTFSIVINASLFNHETQYKTFTLTGVVVPTVLTALPSSTTITVNQSYVLQLYFHDEDLNPINTATITPLSPPSGISISSAIPIGSGLYNITIRSAEINIYNLLFRASAVNYQSSIVGFTVSVTALPTSLEILNAGSIPVENGLNEIFTVQLSYELLNGTGVAGAVPIFVFTGPSNGLLWGNFIDNDNGLYSLDVLCNTSATYGITITFSKPYYYNTSGSFTLIIGETGSELELLNGTADVVLFGDSYRLVVEYRNSTGYGLPGSDLQVVTITPLSGFTHSNFSHIVDGYYEITLTPSAAGTFSIVISASILNHETQYATFTLTASGIPTILTSLPSEKTVAVNQTFTLQLRFLDEDLNTINVATITLLTPHAGLVVTSAVPIGSGLYNLTLQSSEIETYDLLFRATADNYQSSSAAFTFVVTQIQTTMTFASDITSTIVDFREPFELVVYYDRNDPIEAVQGATITVLPATSELDIQIVEHSGYYSVIIRGDAIGSWALTIVANKTDYRISTKSFFIEIEEIDTTVQMSSPVGLLYIGRSYTFTFDYIFESNDSAVRGATITPFGAGADWVTYLELVSGQYLVNLTPQELGEHSVILTFERLGFGSFSFRLNFEVNKIPITVEVIQGLNAPELSQSVLLVNITESDTGNPAQGVAVYCYVIDPSGAPIDSVTMIETSTAGIYSATITMPDIEGVYHIEIACEAMDYILSPMYSTTLLPQRDFMSMIIVATTRYYPVLILIAALCIGLVYRRAARKKRIRENKETLAIKRRFDDVRSLLGVIVLHKESGLPVYSKILREGLEETVISAFITAITSFRGEFDIETSSEEWGLIPISDIVRVISTNKLVCAFITTGNPSADQRERMIQFAKTVGFIFDETMEDVPVVVLDHHTTAQFNALFEDLLDGQLLRTYKLDDSKKFPTTTCANERIARKHGVEFKLEELASEIASCGLEEGRVYKAIMVALENHYLVRTEDSPFSTELLRASDVVHEES